MSEYRNRPKGKYIQQAAWDELYILTEHWKSDLEFYRDDLRFLHLLIDKYFMWITKKENLDLVREIKKNLYNVGKKSDDLLAKVGKHLIQLGRMVENPDARDGGISKMEHEHLEDEIADFVKSFRLNRKEVFTITGYIIDSEQLPHIFES